MPASRSTRIVLFIYGLLVIGFLYLPLISVGFASISRARYLTFPIKRYSTKWYAEAVDGEQHRCRPPHDLLVGGGPGHRDLRGDCLFRCAGFCALSVALSLDLPEIDPAADFLPADRARPCFADVVQRARHHPELEDRRGRPPGLDSADRNTHRRHPRL